MFLSTIFSKLLKKSRLSSIRLSTIHPSAKVESGSSVYSSSFGRYSFCGYDCDLYFAEVGSFTSIGSRVIVGSPSHPMDWVGMSPVFYKGRDSIRTKFSVFSLGDVAKTSIGHDVWIGNSAIILSGVRIGNGAIVGAGAVVTKDVPPYGIVAGNPAKLIRYRFDTEIVSELEKIKWWELPDKILVAIAQYVRDPKEFISFYYRLNLRS
jgi:acetyltransferase-like isoleucine patch superfamily enzyme